ncbi:MAG: hypothetical protein FWC26_03605, partial [Fibromonadales bacterium]|nr:hypothetical protein [Fibromonadales bacterium]
MLRFILPILILASFALAEGESKIAAWITLEGDVDPGMNDYARRAIAEASAKKPDLIIFEINTF